MENACPAVCLSTFFLVLSLSYSLTHTESETVSRAPTYRQQPPYNPIKPKQVRRCLRPTSSLLSQVCRLPALFPEFSFPSETAGTTLVIVSINTERPPRKRPTSRLYTPAERGAPVASLATHWAPLIGEQHHYSQTEFETDRRQEGSFKRSITWPPVQPQERSGVHALLQEYIGRDRCVREFELR